MGLDLVRILKGGKLLQSDFLIGRRPVTVREFQEIVGGEVEGAAESNPVKLATWAEALRFCNLLCRQAGQPPAYDEPTGVLLNAAGTSTRDLAEVAGFRLPTGTEWDYAARGGRPDPPYADWGAVLDRTYWDDPTSHFANPVAPKEPVTNVLGLVGMLGYVREWYSHCLPNQDSRQRVCGWGHYYTNYDCFIAWHVTGEVVPETARYPFRLAAQAQPLIGANP
jgi:formylglycine-generating enzyme required for sulfatase activity